MHGPLAMRSASKRGRERMKCLIAMNPEVDLDGWVWARKIRLGWEDLEKSRMKSSPLHDEEGCADVSTPEPAGTCWLRNKEKEEEARRACGV